MKITKHSSCELTGRRREVRVPLADHSGFRGLQERAVEIDFGGFRSWSGLFGGGRLTSVK